LDYLVAEHTIAPVTDIPASEWEVCPPSHFPGGDPLFLLRIPAFFLRLSGLDDEGDAIAVTS